MMDIAYILLALAALRWFFKGPAYGTAALAFLIPVSRRLPSLPIPLLNTQNLMVLAALAAMLVRPRGRDRVYGGGKVRFWAPMAGFIFLVTFAFASTMLFFVPERYAFAYQPYTILITYKNLLTCFLIYMLGCLASRTREDIEIILKGLMFGAAFEAAWVCMEIVWRGPARANGHLMEGNNAGAFLAGSVTIALALFLMYGWRRREGQFSLATAVGSAIGLVFTMSRGNWLTGILSGGAIAMIRDRRIVILLVVMVMGYQVWMPQKALDRINDSFIPEEEQGWRFLTKQDTDEAAAIGGLQRGLLGGEQGEGSSEMVLDTSSQVRLYVWKATLSMIADYPFGVGYGVFPFYLGYYSDVIKFRAAHNSFLMIAAEIGLHGLALFIIFLLALMVEGWLAYRSATDPLLKGLGLAAVGTVVAMMGSALWYNFFFIIEVNGHQWLILGMAAQVRGILRASESAVAAAPAIGQPVAAPSAPPPEPVPLYKLIT